MEGGTVGESSLIGVGFSTEMVDAGWSTVGQIRPELSWCRFVEKGKAGRS